MKRSYGIMLAVSILAVVGMATLWRTALSQEATAPKPRIGMVDFEKIMKDHPVMVKWQVELERLKAERETEMEKQIKENYGITDQTELSEQQRAQIQRIIYQESQKFTADMEPKQLEKMKQVEDDLKEVGAVVATEKQLELVLLRHVVVYGAVDITDVVMEKIKKKYP